MRLNLYNFKRYTNDTIAKEKYNVVYYREDGRVRIGATPQKTRDGKKVKIGNKQVYYVVAMEKKGRLPFRYVYYSMPKGVSEMTREVQKLLRKYKTKKLDKFKVK